MAKAYNNKGAIRDEVLVFLKRCMIEGRVDHTKKGYALLGSNGELIKGCPIGCLNYLYRLKSASLPKTRYLEDNNVTLSNHLNIDSELLDSIDYYYNLEVVVDYENANKLFYKFFELIQPGINTKGLLEEADLDKSKDLTEFMAKLTKYLRKLYSVVRLDRREKLRIASFQKQA